METTRKSKQKAQKAGLQAPNSAVQTKTEWTAIQKHVPWNGSRISTPPPHKGLYNA